MVEHWIVAPGVEGSSPFIHPIFLYIFWYITSSPTLNMSSSPLPKNVRLFGWSSLFTDVGSEIVFPLLPLYLTMQLGTGPMALGFIEGLADAVSSLLKLLSGKLSDRFKKRKIIILIGYGLSTFSKVFLALASTWPLVLGIRVSDRIGKGIRTAPRDALLAQSLDQKNLGRGFGFQRRMDHVGEVVGALCASALLYIFNNQFKPIFILAAIPGFISFALLTRVTELPFPEKKVSLTPEIPNTKTKPIKRLTKIQFFLGLIFLFNLSNMTDAFLILRLKEGGVSLALIPLLWAGLSLIKSIVTDYFGKFSDHFNRKILILIGWGFSALVYLALAQNLSTPILTLFFLGYGLYYGLTEGPERALLAELAPPQIQSTFFGYYYSLIGLALLPASLFFGYLWKTGGFKLAYLTGSAIAFVAVGLGFLSWFIFNKKSEPT